VLFRLCFVAKRTKKDLKLNEAKQARENETEAKKETRTEMKINEGTRCNKKTVFRKEFSPSIRVEGNVH
jgi:hypothetical protein